MASGLGKVLLVASAFWMAMSGPSVRYITLLKDLYRVNLLNPVKMGLHTTHRLNELLGFPIAKIPVVHVAGTNGKGSVCLKTAEALSRSGLRTGLFVSPHISSFRERIQVDGVPISEEDVVALLPQLLDLCEKHRIAATFFELTTLLSFMSFRKANCDAVVLEVGLGGRLDSTNVVTPALSIITSIQLDHTKILGDTIEKIALEKAGIMKPGVPVLVGPGCPIEVMQKEAARVGALFHTLDAVLQPLEQKYRKGKQHDIDDLNVDISRAALMLLRNTENIKGALISGVSSSNCFSRLFSPKTLPHIEAALACRPPCRFQRILVGDDIEVILDIAHNEEAIAALVAKINATYGSGCSRKPTSPSIADTPLDPDPASASASSAVPMRVVLGISADKDVAKCLTVLVGLFESSGDVRQAVKRVHCTAAQHPRAMDCRELQRCLASAALTAAHTYSLFTPIGYVAPSEDDVDALLNDAAPAVAPASQALEQAMEQCRLELQSFPNLRGRRGVVVVCGTAFIMAEVRAALGIEEPRDGDFLAANRDSQEYFAM